MFLNLTQLYLTLFLGLISFGALYVIFCIFNLKKEFLWPIYIPLTIIFMMKIFKLLRFGVKSEQVNHKITNYNKLFDQSEQENNQIESRKTEYKDMVDTYYSLVTDLYEFGWGQSFHFSNRFKGESHQESMVRSEHFLAGRLGLKRGMKVADIGCGIGGPMRNVAKFTEAQVEGITINQYQVSKVNMINKNQGLDHLCKARQGDFNKLEEAFGPEMGTFDCSYAIEAICHSQHFQLIRPDPEFTYKEINKLLKPNGKFATYEWVMTPKYDPSNKDHQRIKHGIEEGDALPEIRTPEYYIEKLQNAGFRVLEHYDMYDNYSPKNQLPWYYMIMGNWNLEGFRMTKLGKKISLFFVYLLQFFRIFPKGTVKVVKMLNIAAESLTEAGQLGIFCPSYYILAEKI